MQKTLKPIQYDYYIRSITENDTPAYQAIIPAFDHAIVYGDNLKELEKGVRFTIESEIRERKKLKKPIPKSEKSSQASGKIFIRLNPFLHERLILEAKAAGKSLNRYIEQRLAHF